MRTAIRALACAVGLVAALCAPAVAAPANGQLAAVIDGRLLTVNADGSGQRTLATAEPVSEVAFSPDGNRLAFVQRGRISVLELTTGRVVGLTAGTADANLGWSADGARVAFRRGQSAYTVASTGGLPQSHPLVLDPNVSQLAWAPDLTRVAQVVDGALPLAGGAPVTGAPAWSPDGRRIAFANDRGVLTIPSAGGTPELVGPAPAAGPRWSADSTAIVYGAGAHLRIVEAAGGRPRNVLSGLSAVTAVDWQPCTPGVTRSCESARPPHCATTTSSVTTQVDQPAYLPAPPCGDPAGRSLATVVERGPEFGTLNGWHYTPAPGFSGQDLISYRVSNGASESELLRLTILVVPRAVAPVVVAPSPRPAPRGAPFLTAKRQPRLTKARRASVRLACDQDCRFSVRLWARLRGGKQTRGPRVRRTLPADMELRVRLRLPRKPKGAIRTVWIKGHVYNAAGDKRAVRLPVRRPR